MGAEELHKYANEKLDNVARFVHRFMRRIGDIDAIQFGLVCIEDGEQPEGRSSSNPLSVILDFWLGM